VLVRSRDHAKYAGTAPASFASDLAVTDRSVFRNVSVDGEPVLQAVVRLNNGWLAVAEIPITIAEGPLRRSLWLWALLSFSALVLAGSLAWALARTMSRPITVATDAAAALGRGEAVRANSSSLLEANTLVSALQSASCELSERADHQRLLLNELSHRVKNVLAVVQAIIARTLSDERSIHEGRRILGERVLALARAHELLMRTDWKGVSLTDIIQAELEPFSNRLSLEGPAVIVDGKVVQTLALVIHELATNAAKHGALSNDAGRVFLRWSVDGAGDDARFKFRWEERHGPSVAPPTRKGFGSTLLETAITADLKIKPRLSFEAGGFVYELDVPLRAVQGS
jgi:two-component sensor histidine kinase